MTKKFQLVVSWDTLEEDCYQQVEGDDPLFSSDEATSGHLSLSELASAMEYIKLVEIVSQNATGMIRGLEGLSCEERGLFSTEKRRLGEMGNSAMCSNP